MLKIVALAGGVGGAKLAWGLAKVCNSQDLAVIVNTGDDFEHMGLKISPDIDTVCYTLANMENPETGWGRANETWNCFHELDKVGGPTWFNLGDSDLALHLQRTDLLNSGLSLTQVTKYFCDQLGVKIPVLPMTDFPVRTMISTKEKGKLPFQEYFVKYRCQPAMENCEFSGIEKCELSKEGKEALEGSDLVIICPSNPWVSISPILEVKDVKKILKRKIVIAVSPIIAGKTVKGPAAKMFAEMGIKPSAYAVAKFYNGLIKGFILDTKDKDQISKINQCGIISFATETLMYDKCRREKLAQQVISFSASLAKV